MNIRKMLAMAVLALPVAAGMWIFDTIQSADATLNIESPRYPNVSASGLASLSTEQLATATAGTIAKFKQMDVLWHGVRAAEERLLNILLAVIGVLAIACSALLWRSPPNSTVERDARNSSARPTP